MSKPAIAPRRILVVDDEPSILRMMGRVLLETGHPVLTASNGQEALDVIAETHPAVVIADIRMPIMDGLELTRRIKLDHPGTRVLLISAYHEPTVHDADSFIGKPFDNDELLARVTSLISDFAADAF